ncbi:hypothetical protein [Lysobacter sp. A289]
MDRQDAKPRRPSLLAGTPAQATPASSARILADMAGGKPASPKVANRPRRWWLRLSLAALVVLVGGGLWQGGLWQGGSGATGSLPPEPPAQPTPHAASDASMIGPAMRFAATIIDDASGLPTAAPGAADSRNDPRAQDGSASRSAPSATGPSPFAGIAVATRARRDAGANLDSSPTSPPTRPVNPRDLPRASPAAGTGDKQADLLATLLRNIKAPAHPQPSGLDALILKMEATDKVDPSRRVSRADAAPSRSQQIQENLRECPAPNSAKGLKCRQEICAVYAGRDPACPAM